MATYITSLFKNIYTVLSLRKPNIPIDINNLHEVKLTRFDTWNTNNQNNSTRNDYIWRIYFLSGTVPEYDVTKCYLPNKSSDEIRRSDECLASKGIAYIAYRTKTGQIGLFFIKPEYRNSGLGKQILLRAIDDIRNNNCMKVFAITSENHPFWSNVFKQSFRWSQRPDMSVTGSGYCLELFDV